MTDRDYLKDIKPQLDLTEEVYELSKDRIESLIRITEAQLKTLLKSDEVPENLAYIVILVVIKRFNRFGDEGASSVTHSEKKVDYYRADFDEFKQEIRDYLDENDESKKRVVRFL